MSNEQISDCRCGNAYLAIRTDLYKDGREFVYCDCCGALADHKTWQAAGRASLAGAAEPVVHMEVLNPGAVTYCLAEAAKRLPPGEYRLYTAPQPSPAQAAPQQVPMLMPDAELIVQAVNSAPALLAEVDALRNAGQRVTDAFRLLGRAGGARKYAEGVQECKAAMLNLDAALRTKKGGRE